MNRPGKRTRHKPAGVRMVLARFYIAACTCGWETPTLRTEEAARAHLIDRHVTKAGFPPCPTKQRTRYATAERAAHRLRTWQLEAKPGQQIPIRTYRCECGWWHLTSTPIRQETSA